jgi:hypothetical protein
MVSVDHSVPVAEVTCPPHLDSVIHPGVTKVIKIARVVTLNPFSNLTNLLHSKVMGLQSLKRFVFQSVAVTHPFRSQIYDRYWVSFQSQKGILERAGISSANIGISEGMI